MTQAATLTATTGNDMSRRAYRHWVTLCGLKHLHLYMTIMTRKKKKKIPVCGLGGRRESFTQGTVIVVIVVMSWPNSPLGNDLGLAQVGTGE